jgi:hypothetical protein
MKILDDTKYEWMCKVIDLVPKEKKPKLEYRPSREELHKRWDDNTDYTVPEIQIAILTLERFRDFVLSNCKDKDSVMSNLDLWIERYEKEFSEEDV